MSITTLEFEQHLNGWLAGIENWRRCEWCGCDDGQKRIGPRSKLCDSCKEWRRKERLALKWQQENPNCIGKEEGIHYEYCIQFANLCREEGHIQSWKGPITAIELESELEFLTEIFFGKKDKIGGTIIEFKQFSDAQRRLLMYIFRRMHKVWLQHSRRNFAIDAAVAKYLLGNQPDRRVVQV
ncbi:MAG: hypothetical protein WAN35_08830 [Terracidiphilus sp.]